MKSHPPSLRLIIALGAVLLSACSASGWNPTPALGGSAWILSELPPRPLVPDSQITLRFEGSRLGGSDGCNRYGGSYVADASQFRLVGDLVSTQMACPPPAITQADAFRAALQRAAANRLTADTLELLDANGVVLARFTAQPRQLAGTTWEVIALNNGGRALASVLPGSSLSLGFGSDGHVSGSAGCNRFIADYRKSGNTLTFSTPVATRRHCTSPGGVMAQEAALLAALEAVAVMRREGDRLELRTADGLLAVSLRISDAAAGTASAASDPRTP